MAVSYSVLQRRSTSSGRWSGTSAGRIRRPSIAPRCAPCRKHRTQTRTPDVGLVQGGRQRLPRNVRRCPPPAINQPAATHRCESPGARADQRRVRFDGRDIRSLDPRELRRHATLVLQTPVLFATPFSPSTSRWPTSRGPTRPSEAGSADPAQRRDRGANPQTSCRSDRPVRQLARELGRTSIAF